MRAGTIVLAMLYLFSSESVFASACDDELKRNLIESIKQQSSDANMSEASCLVYDIRSNAGKLIYSFEVLYSTGLVRPAIDRSKNPDRILIPLDFLFRTVLVQDAVRLCEADLSFCSFVKSYLREVQFIDAGISPKLLDDINPELGEKACTIRNGETYRANVIPDMNSIFVGVGLHEIGHAVADGLLMEFPSSQSELGEAAADGFARHLMAKDPSLHAPDAMKRTRIVGMTSALASEVNSSKDHASSDCRMLLFAPEFAQRIGADASSCADYRAESASGIPVAQEFLDAGYVISDRPDLCKPD